ncbi:MAG: thermonuclease family protein [Acidovorax sp.]|nr:thermonuclease family protein [Acidovorax sp.]
MLSTALLCLIVGISDGDTLSARCPTEDAAHPYLQVKVRLAGIDAPEKAQPYGARAKQALSDLTYLKQARLDCVKQDRYRRSVCNVWVAPASAPDGPQTLDAGLTMVTVGMAWWYRAYAKEQTPQARGQYAFAETEAKAKRAGLWADPEPIPPWEWRKSKKEQHP